MWDGTGGPSLFNIPPIRQQIPIYLIISSVVGVRAFYISYDMDVNVTAIHYTSVLYVYSTVTEPTFSI